MNASLYRGPFWPDCVSRADCSRRCDNLCIFLFGRADGGGFFSGDSLNGISCRLPQKSGGERAGRRCRPFSLIQAETALIFTNNFMAESVIL